MNASSAPLILEQKRSITVKIAFRIHVIVNQLINNVRLHFYKYLGAKIGNGVKLGKVIMPLPEQIVICDGCELEDYVRLRAGGKWKRSSIRIGAGTFIGHSTQVNVGSHFMIGEKCLIAPMCIFSDAHHSFANVNIPIKDQECSYNPIVIEDDVWIGTGSIIIGGVKIHKGAVVAAGAVITCDIPPFEIWGGVPAKKLKSRIN